MDDLQHLVDTIAAWSPGLNETGNSQLAARALKRLTDETGWSIFGADQAR